MRVQWRDLSVHFPLMLVMLSLVTAALVPMLVHRRIEDSLDDIEQVVEPARDAVGDIQLALALEAAGTRGFLLTGDDAYAKSHLAARATRARAYARLLDTVPRLQPELRTAVIELGDLLRPADLLLDRLYGGGLTRKEYMTHLTAQHKRFEAVIGAIGGLQQAIGRSEQLRRDRIHAAQEAGTLVTWVTLLLAFAALAVVARLGARHRALAERERKARAAVETARADAEAGRLEIERVSASRERLMRGLSHDVKNPLGVTEGYLSMLERGVMAPLAPRQLDGVRKARRSVQAALRMIEESLEIARASTCEIQVRLAPVDLRDAAARIVEDYAAQAAAKALELDLDLPATFPLVRTDGSRVGEILGNLVANAVKFTTAGGVTVSLASRFDDAACECAVLEVSDTGPGIPRDRLEWIFAEYHRLEGAGNTGSGIGLAISQQMARALGGRISVESEAGRGSRFSLWLPLDPDADPEARPGESVLARR